MTTWRGSDRCQLQYADSLVFSSHSLFMLPLIRFKRGKNVLVCTHISIEIGGFQETWLRVARRPESCRPHVACWQRVCVSFVDNFVIRAVVICSCYWFAWVVRFTCGAQTSHMLTNITDDLPYQMLHSSAWILFEQYQTTHWLKTQGAEINCCDRPSWRNWINTARNSALRVYYICTNMYS